MGQTLADKVRLIRYGVDLLRKRKEIENHPGYRDYEAALRMVEFAGNNLTAALVDRLSRAAQQLDQ